MERQELEEEIDRLRRDKSLLQLELESHNQEKQEYEYQLRSFGERLKVIEQKQRQMIVFLAQELQEPRFGFSHIQLSENHNKKRRVLISNRLYAEANMEENQILTSLGDNPDATFPVLNSDFIEKLESSLLFWENFLQGVDQIPSEEMNDFGLVPLPSSVTITEMQESSRDSDVNADPSSFSLNPSSPDSRDVHSSPDLAGSSTHFEAPTTSSIALHVDVRPKPLAIDVNSKPAVTPAAVATGANDVFWEQFLTETPGTSHTQEVQSERRDINGKKSENKPDSHKFLWNMNNVDNLTEQMGHLTPAEST